MPPPDPSDHLRGSHSHQFLGWPLERVPASGEHVCVCCQDNREAGQRKKSPPRLPLGSRKPGQIHLLQEKKLGLPPLVSPSVKGKKLLFPSSLEKTKDRTDKNRVASPPSPKMLQWCIFQVWWKPVRMKPSGEQRPGICRVIRGCLEPSKSQTTAVATNNRCLKAFI